MRKLNFVILFLIVGHFCFFSFLIEKTYAQRQDKVYGTNTDNNPSQGSVHTWVDPQTGDTITSVRKGQNNTQNNTNNYNNMPVIVYPQVTPGYTPYPPYPLNSPGSQVLPVLLFAPKVLGKNLGGKKIFLLPMSAEG